MIASNHRPLRALFPLLLCSGCPAGPGTPGADAGVYETLEAALDERRTRIVEADVVRVDTSAAGVFWTDEPGGVRSLHRWDEEGVLEVDYEFEIPDRHGAGDSAIVTATRTDRGDQFGFFSLADGTDINPGWGPLGDDEDDPRWPFVIVSDALFTATEAFSGAAILLHAAELAPTGPTAGVDDPVDLDALGILWRDVHKMATDGRWFPLARSLAVDVIDAETEAVFAVDGSVGDGDMAVGPDGILLETDGGLLLVQGQDVRNLTDELADADLPLPVRWVDEQLPAHCGAAWNGDRIVYCAAAGLFDVDPVTMDVRALALVPSDALGDPPWTKPRPLDGDVVAIAVDPPGVVLVQPDAG